jgi:hypothetical protein
VTKIDSNLLFFGNFVDADLKLIELADYLNDVNKFINRKKRYKEKKIKNNILKDISINMFAESFTSILFDSVLISTWLFMEAEFKGYCNAMRTAMKMELSYSDLKGSVIDRFRKYTSKVLKLDFKLTNDNWEDFKAINEIRNSLVHGVIENKQLINKFIKHHKLTGLLLEDNISIDKTHLTVIITLCRLFIERIYCVALEKFPGQYGRKHGGLTTAYLCN